VGFRSAVGLKALDVEGKTCVVLSCAGRTEASAVVPKTLSPSWENAHFQFEDVCESDELTVEMFDMFRAPEKGNSMGQVIVPVRAMTGQPASFRLQPTHGCRNPHGLIRLRCTATGLRWPSCPARAQVTVPVPVPVLLPVWEPDSKQRGGSSIPGAGELVTEQGAATTGGTWLPAARAVVVGGLGLALGLWLSAPAPEVGGSGMHAGCTEQLPCLHGGRLPDPGAWTSLGAWVRGLPYKGECICPSSHSGVRCEVDLLDECGSNPCYHGGTCVDNARFESLAPALKARLPGMPAAGSFVCL
jgi:hypothetical protein